MTVTLTKYTNDVFVRDELITYSINTSTQNSYTSKIKAAKQQQT